MKASCPKHLSGRRCEPVSRQPALSLNLKITVEDGSFSSVGLSRTANHWRTALQSIRVDRTWNFGCMGTGLMGRRLALTAGMILALIAGTASAEDKLKVGFVYVGPVSDHGWTYRHDVGRLAIEEQLGDLVDTVYVENVAEKEAERAITQLAGEGAGLIFTTSFSFQDATIKAAKRFPGIKFEHAAGDRRADNVATYSARFYEGRYVTGRIAARMSKSGVAGYVGSFPIPEVVRGINAFTLGARSIDPDFTVSLVWVNAWFDPDKEADAARVLIGRGADIIAQHTDSTAPLEVAADEGVLGFGLSSDMIAFAPKSQLTAIVNDWAPYYVARVEAVLDGVWKSGDTWGGMEAGMIRMAPYANLPRGVAAMARDAEARIASGALRVFTGPIKRQDGTLVIERGEHLGDSALRSMNWYVTGVDAGMAE